MSVAARAVRSVQQEIHIDAAPLRRHRLRFNWRRGLAAAVVLYLGGLLVYGEIMDVRLQQQSQALQQQVRTVQMQNQALQNRARSLSNPAGESRAARAELGVVPKGQIPVVIVPSNTSTP